MVTFDAAQAGTDVSRWDAHPRRDDRPILELSGVSEVVVFAAHPDDETLGAGGLLAECARRGIPSRIVIVTDGGGSGEAGIVERRAREAEAAASVLGAELTMLGFEDGATDLHRDAIDVAISAIVAGVPLNAMLVAPWRGDGHRDHRVVGELVASVGDGRRLLEYPIWMWHWAHPDADDVPWDSFVALEVPLETKRRAIAEYASQTKGDQPMLRPDMLEHFDRPTELFVAAAPVATEPLAVGYFDALYDRHDDPWGFLERWYEQRKRAVTLASLPDERYRTGLELGCSIGVLTDALAGRVTELLAVDSSQAAVDRARRRVGSRARIERADALTEFPEGRFDLIVLSEVGYYFGKEGLSRILDSVDAALGERGILVACHWRHPVADYPLTGDAVHEAIRARNWTVLASHVEEDFVLEVLSRDARSVAVRTGLR